RVLEPLAKVRLARLRVGGLEAARAMEVDALSHLALEPLERIAGFVPELRQHWRRIRLAREPGGPRRRLRAESTLIHERDLRAAPGKVIGGAGSEGTGADDDCSDAVHGASLAGSCQGRLRRHCPTERRPPLPHPCETSRMITA